jgi:hypothetical protein
VALGNFGNTSFIASIRGNSKGQITSAGSFYSISANPTLNYPNALKNDSYTHNI